MKYYLFLAMKLLVTPSSSLAAFLLLAVAVAEAGPKLTVERSVKVSFDSEVGKSYNAYSSNDVSKKNWKLLGGPVDGNGEKIVFFYQSKDDQKVFFKVDEIEKGGESGGGNHKKDISITDRWNQFLKDNKKKLDINLAGLTSNEDDLHWFRTNDDGKMELEVASIRDTVFKGTYNYQDGYDDINQVHTFDFKLLGVDAKYTIAYIPAVFVENVDEPYFYGTYILSVTAGGQTTRERGNFWLGITED
jgi:hypothetical protein